MIITQTNIGSLTLNTSYLVKFATLGHTPSLIKVITNDGTNCSVQFYDTTATPLLQQTILMPVGTSVFLIDTTQ
jgi:hypothetical protein